jgi:hypothetical protein
LATRADSMGAVADAHQLEFHCEMAACSPVMLNKFNV